jgi:hypothetical protein
MTTDRPRRVGQLVRVAYHEAAHAAIADLVGWDIVRVTTRRKALSLGAVFARMPDLEKLKETGPREMFRHAVTAQIAVYLAGALAECRLLRTAAPRRVMCDGEVRDDYIKARQTAALLWPLPKTAVAQCELQVRHVLNEHWPKVEALAESLIEHRVLYGPRVRAILATAQPLPRPPRQLRFLFMEADGRSVAVDGYPRPGGSKQRGVHDEPPFHRWSGGLPSAGCCSDHVRQWCRWFVSEAVPAARSETTGCRGSSG